MNSKFLGPVIGKLNPLLENRPGSEVNNIELHQQSLADQVHEVISLHDVYSFLHYLSFLSTLLFSLPNPFPPFYPTIAGPQNSYYSHLILATALSTLPRPYIISLLSPTSAQNLAIYALNPHEPSSSAHPTKLVTLNLNFHPLNSTSARPVADVNV